jgi:ABC-2 type transport system ATP-binding protein
VEGIKKNYLHSFSLQIDELTLTTGSIHLFVGPNGAGKTTLLRCIMGLTRFSGTIERREVERIGYAPESYVMPEFLTVIEFLIGLGRVRKRRSDEMELAEYLEWFNLTEMKNKPIGRLSNGMRQKVNLIQALMHHPSVLLLDEPLRALDKESQQKCLERIHSLRHQTLVLVSTHEPDLFRKRASKLYRLEAGRLVD